MTASRPIKDPLSQRHNLAQAFSTKHQKSFPMALKQSRRVYHEPLCRSYQDAYESVKDALLSCLSICSATTPRHTCVLGLFLFSASCSASLPESGISTPLKQSHTVKKISDVVPAADRRWRAQIPSLRISTESDSSNSNRCRVCCFYSCLDRTSLLGEKAESIRS